MENLSYDLAKLDLQRAERDLIDKAAMDARRKIWMSAYKLHYEENPEELTQFADIKSVGIMDRYLKKARIGIKAVMITVNPREGVGLDLLIKAIKKCCRKKWINDGVFALEQRSRVESDLGRGMHCHIYANLKTYKRPAAIRREVWNTFKNLCDNNRHVDIKMCYVSDTEQKMANFRKYCSGEKDTNGNGKIELVHMDDVWRSRNRLDSYYEFSNEN